MPSHHERNSIGVKPEDVQGPGSPSVVSKINVSYGITKDFDGPAPVVTPSQEPYAESPEPEIDGPNVPNPMGPNTVPKY